MALFKKQLQPEKLGAIVYERLRKELEGNGDLALDHLLHNLGLESANDQPEHAGDVIVALMFAATMAIERSAPEPVAVKIVSGMKSEFLSHLREQGATALQAAEWEATLASSFLVYRTCLEDYSGFEPPWKLGRQFFWNLIGREEYVAMAVKIATLYLIAARDAVQELLNKYGPAVILPRSVP
jgi:hypothetical protein